MERNQERKVCLAGDPGTQGLGKEWRRCYTFHRIFQSMGHLISCKANSLAVNLVKMELDEEVIREVQEREGSAMENFNRDRSSLEAV